LMSEKEKGIVGKTVDRVRQAFKWNVEETGDRAGIDFLNRGGFMRERQDNIERMNEKSYVQQDSLYTRTTLPWLSIGEDDDNFEKNDAFLDALDYYNDLSNWILGKIRARMVVLNERLMEENLQRRLRGEDEVPLYTLEDFRDMPIDPELEAYRDRVAGYLTWMAKINLGLSFKNPDDNKALVLNKQVIVEPNPQTAEVFRMLKQAMGPDKLSPESV